MKVNRIDKIIDRLKKKYPKAGLALNHTTPMQLLAAVIMSAQCTDKRVNLVTQNLFKKYVSVKDFAEADTAIFETEIHSTGFYKAKARNIVNSAKMILNKYDGRIPDTMDDILDLPGVARKTANIVLGNVYNVVEGIAVDTHVMRLSQRLGLTKQDDPVKIEKDLMELVPRKYWLKVSYLLQSLGRDVCLARKPDHGACVLRDICPSSKIV